MTERYEESIKIFQKYLELDEAVADATKKRDEYIATVGELLPSTNDWKARDFLIASAFKRASESIRIDLGFEDEFEDCSETPAIFKKTLWYHILQVLKSKPIKILYGGYEGSIDTLISKDSGDFGMTDLITLALTLEHLSHRLSIASIRALNSLRGSFNMANSSERKKVAMITHIIQRTLELTEGRTLPIDREINKPWERLLTEESKFLELIGLPPKEKVAESI